MSISYYIRFNVTFKEATIGRESPSSGYQETM